MSAFFPDQDQYPFNAVVLIAVTWSDGSRSRGSGAIVGRNDILTAAHVVYRPGRTATDIDIYPAYDGAEGPWGAFTEGAWRADYNRIAFVQDTKLTQAESARDLALIGVSDPIGDRTGYLGMAANAGSGTYQVIGYPGAQGDRLIQDVGFVGVENGTYLIGGIYHAPGSSGGPLLNAANQVVGVVSTLDWGARIDSEWEALRGWMLENDSLLPAPAWSFSVLDSATGTVVQRAASRYAGPVAHLEFQCLGSEGGEAIGGTARADFINALGGADAVDAGGGRDVIDGGTGSNFLVGGAEADVFFLDGRGGQTTWSTITDWGAGEQLSIWGFVPGRSTLRWEANAGTEGFRGLTLHCDLDGDGVTDTSVTWTGLTGQGQLPAPQAHPGLLWFI